MRPVPGPRNRTDARADEPLVTAEADLLIEAIALLGQRQQETEAWAAERVQLADERVLAVEQRQLDLERKLDNLEKRLAQTNQFAPQLPAAPEERLERLRQHVEDLRTASVYDETNTDPLREPHESPALEAPTSTERGPALTAEPRLSPVRPAVARTPPASPPAAKRDVRQRLESVTPRGMDMALLVLGVLVVLFAGLWQIAQVLGFS
jgi:hypothetical protein